MGIIGLGAMGSAMLDAASDHPDVVVTAAADVSADLVARFRRSHPGLDFGTDPETLIASDLDALYIATPPAFHADYALAALERGIAVMCEKPLAVDLADGLRMLTASRERGVACAVNFALSDRNAVLEIDRALAAGEVGEVVGVDVRLRFPVWPREFQAGATWVAGRDQGGFVREVFSHFAYLTDRLLGPLRVVSAGVDYPSEGAETSAYGILSAGGIPVHVSGFAGTAAEESYEWTLWGTRRSYRLSDWDQLFVTEGGPWSRVKPPGERGSEATRLALFAQAVRGVKVANLADFAAAYRVQQVVEAFHRASPAGA